MARLSVRKTYKLYINGEFPRTESGRFYPIRTKGGDLVANASRGSRKDLRNAVQAARKAVPGWSARTAYNRGQILYRIAEMVEDRADTFVEQIVLGEVDEDEARVELERSVDRLVWYAGWADKYHQVVGNLNPVAGPFFNISTPEPTGVVGQVAPERPALLGLVSRLAPIVIGGNTVVTLASEELPLPAITLAESMATADVPAGVVNIVTGLKDELVPILAGHMDVNALDAFGLDWDALAEVERSAAENVKRVARPPQEPVEWAEAQSPYWIGEFTEIKTVWHPKGR